MVKAGGAPVQVADAVTAGVLEAAGIDLVDDRFAPPELLDPRIVRVTGEDHEPAAAGSAPEPGPMLAVAGVDRGSRGEMRIFSAVARPEPARQAMPPWTASSSGSRCVMTGAGSTRPAPASATP